MVAGGLRDRQNPRAQSCEFGLHVVGRPGLWPAHFHPHTMVYVPNYDNSMLGCNEVGGQAFVIPVDDKLAIKTK